MRRNHIWYPRALDQSHRSSPSGHYSGGTGVSLQDMMDFRPNTALYGSPFKKKNSFFRKIKLSLHVK